MKSEFVRYIISGVVNTFVGFLTFVLLVYAFGLNLYASNARGYGAGLTCAFLLNRYFVFEGAQITSGAIGHFLISFAAAFVINQAVLSGLSAGLSLSPVLSQIGAMTVYTVTFYFMNKYLVFRVQKST
jgi:putative flippase GtrA